MNINGIDFHNNLILAPMAGVTDVGFREICSLMGADATYSEMLSARAMMHNPKKTSLMTICSPYEKIKIGQIFGHEPQVMADALSNPMLEHYDIVDINMGCPAPKIVKNGEGSALMGNINLAKDIISACVQNSQKPISVKFRLGVDKDISLDFGRMCEEAGASFVTLHARTASQGYSGNADLEKIASLKAKLSIPVVGNGDVIDVASYNKMLATGVDGVMIGRGAQGNPWLFSLLQGKEFDGDKFELIKRHVEILRKYYDEDWATLYMRKHFLWYTSSIEGASKYRIQLSTSDSLDKSLDILKEILSK
ncbi:MAG: tRNA-dihydrouridine synthase family protein [Clostridiales bacterium]|nr:tRNA-dihydrouridine synthase family protein [Clostridiales bacterium]